MSHPSRNSSWHEIQPSSPSELANSGDTLSAQITSHPPEPSQLPRTSSHSGHVVGSHTSSSILGHVSSGPIAYWEGAAKGTLLSARMMLTFFTIASAVVLTLFSSSGTVKFEGQLIKWKLFLYTLQLEAALFVFVRDCLALGVDYLLVYVGMTRSQLSHALSVTTSLRRVNGATYKAIIIAVTALGSIIGPVLLSLVLLREGDGNNLVQAEDMQVATNCIGGRIRQNFGATGEDYLFNTSNEKFKITAGAEHYVVYLKAGTARQVFVPKTPQIGSYSRDCNSDKNDKVVAASVLDVDGLLYKCNPDVTEVHTRIEDFAEIGAGTSSDTFRILADNHAPVGSDKEKAAFNVTFAVKKDDSSTAILKIPCDVTAASANLDIVMNNAGIMGMSIEDGSLEEQAYFLPPRVLGDQPNELEHALENSIGRKGIGLVSGWAATHISEWEGLIRGVVGSYGIRSALLKTFADLDDNKKAINVLKIAEGVEETQNMRIAALWIPVALAVCSRIVSWLYPSIFNGGLQQVLTWMGVTCGGAGGLLYSETGTNVVVEKKFYLTLKTTDKNDVSLIGLTDTRDKQLGIGSYRYVRRRTNRGLLRGLGFMKNSSKWAVGN